MQKEITSPLLKNLYGVKTTWMAVTLFARKFRLISVSLLWLASPHTSCPSNKIKDWRRHSQAVMSKEAHDWRGLTKQCFPILPPLFLWCLVIQVVGCNVTKLADRVCIMVSSPSRLPNMFDVFCHIAQVGVLLTFFSLMTTSGADILAYMELIAGVPTKFKHAYQILSAGISRPDLRDEIYCQLCKQTNYNMNE